jgi:site-specific recombinase XerC
MIEKELSKGNAELIKKYDRSMISESLAKATRHKHLQVILNLTRFLGKNWKDATKDDIENVVVRIVQEYCSDSGQETNTSYDHKKILKIFFRWFKFGSRKKEEVGDPQETKGVKIKKVKDKIVREDLITEEDRTNLLQICADNLRDRAFIDCHSEAGTRPGEILSLQIKHVKFDKYGAQIHVDGKTGPRPIRLVRSTPNLASWIDAHPFRDKPDAPLWISTEPSKFGKQLTYHAAYQMVRRRCRQAKLPKRVYLNLFRHSEATQTAQFMTEAQMRKRHGWTSYSKMPGRYVHLVNADVDNAILSHLGIIKDDNETKVRLPKKCYICDMHNPSESSLCTKCGKPLDLETALEAEQKLQAEQEKNMIEMKEIKHRLEEIECNIKARNFAFASSMLNCDLKNDSTGKIFSILFHVLFEMSAPEEEKKRIWKRALEAAEKGEKFDFSWLGDPKNFSLSNYYDRPISLVWGKNSTSEITSK